MKSELKKEKKKERNEKPSISEMKKISKEGSFSDKFKIFELLQGLDRVRKNLEHVLRHVQRG